MTILFSITFLVSAVLFKLSQKYFIKKNKYDEIKKRSSHTVKATRSGGASIFISLSLIVIYLYSTSNQIFDFSVFLPLGILFTVGLYDDIYQIDFKLKFIFQLIVAKILIDQGIIVSNFNGFLGIYEIPYLLSQLITIFIIVYIINATNFSDGIDGLASTEVVKCLLIVLILNNWSEINNYNFFFVLTLISILPIYYFNFKRNNKVFLGDSGSLLLGGIVSIALVNTNNLELVNINLSLNTPLLILVCYTYPIIDSTYVILKRILAKKSPFIADNTHIHHILLNKGFSHFKCLIVLSGITGIFQFLILIYITKFT